MTAKMANKLRKLTRKQLEAKRQEEKFNMGKWDELAAEAIAKEDVSAHRRAMKEHRNAKERLRRLDAELRLRVQKKMKKWDEMLKALVELYEAYQEDSESEETKAALDAFMKAYNEWQD